MARRFARRKKPRVAWLPVFGGEIDPEDPQGPFAGYEFDLAISGTNNIIWDAVPLTFDVSEAASEAQPDPDKRTLHDIVSGNEWRLRRIVGKIFVGAWNATQGAAVVPAVDAAFGFIVCNTFDDGQPTTDFNEVNPLAQDSMEDPWIWRRRWLLHPFGTTAAQLISTPANQNNRNSPQYWGFPNSNSQYGSVADGPHIDAKCARVIHRSQRLFAVLAIRRFPTLDSLNITDVGVRALLDYRLLGSLRAQSYGNRGNAAR